MMEDSDSKSLDIESNSHDDTPMLAATPKASALPPPTSTSTSTSSSSLPDNTTDLDVISSPNKESTVKQESTTTSTTSSTPNTTSTNSTTPASNHKKRVRAPPTPIDPNEIRKSGRERKPAPILYENAAQKEELSDHLRYHSRLPSKKKREAAKKAAQEAKRASKDGTSSGSKKKKKSTASSSEEESGSESEEETPKKKKAKTTPKKSIPKANNAAGAEGSHVCIIYHAVDDEETKVFVAPAKKVTPSHVSFLSELHGAGANDDSRRDEFVSLLESVFTQIASMTYGEDTDGPVELNRRISSLYHITFL